MTEIRQIRCAEIFADPAWPALLAEYAEECSIKLIGPIQPQQDVYERMEAVGVLRCFGVYRDGRLSGFATVLLPVLPHYGKRPATVESLFVAKAERAGGTGLRLMGAIEENVQDVSDAILYSAPKGGALELILSRHSAYVQTNSVFARSLA